LLQNEKSSNLLFGVSAKFYKDDTLGNSNDSQAFNAGLLWKIPKRNIFLASSIENYGNKYQYGTSYYDLPQKSKLGICGKILDDSVIFGIDCNRYEDNTTYGSFGTEVWLLKALAVRAGYDSKCDQDCAFTYGFGLSLKDLDIYFLYAWEVTLDYAVTSYNKKGDTQFLTLNFKLGAD
jgi:hypothetical protein